MDEDLSEQTRAAYDAVARDYANLIPDTEFEASLDLAMVEAFTQEMSERSDAHILDAGCGAGRMIAYLQTLSPSLRITGIDVSAEMLHLARKAHPRSRFTSAELSSTGYPDREFEGILAWYSIIHTNPTRLSAVVAEFARVLRPGGLVLLGYQSGEGHRDLDQPYGHEVELRAFLYRTGDVVAALSTGGFDLVARLDRAARRSERCAQGFVLARRR
ncbi:MULTISPECIES: class I SAM-dependent DNA methyltransferase [unclassified Pseudoclavibacter]|uniref:class I SAM-dependent DNA methyltransferase n=1 Tax=unclassified Pseudoclavibacter TaxID=2615177 RepID=UPI001BA7DE58|nr:class I SAM-dependent methyltransferase [Pseudoclavibacter sp. Marseille-Q4354]MBS3178120.1 class I SAM-dependent methyltransferase [Pseudoclavibacter sp. Marseille-Q4354]